MKMKKVLIILCCATLLIFGTSLNVCAYVTDNTGGLVGCFSGNDNDYNIQELIEEWLLEPLGFDLIHYAKVEDPPGTSNGLEVGVGAEAYYGSWSSDVALNAYLLKAGPGFELYYLPTPAASGDWAITCLTNDQGIPHDISHFTGYVPIPPTALLLGSGLIGLVGIRRKLRK